MMFRLDRFFLRLPFLLSLAVTLALACHAFSRCGFRTALDGAVACLELALAEQAVRKELFGENASWLSRNKSVPLRQMSKETSVVKSR